MPSSNDHAADQCWLEQRVLADGLAGEVFVAESGLLNMGGAGSGPRLSGFPLNRGLATSSPGHDCVFPASPLWAFLDQTGTNRL